MRQLAISATGWTTATTENLSVQEANSQVRNGVNPILRRGSLDFMLNFISSVTHWANS